MRGWRSREKEVVCSLVCNADRIASLNSRTPENVPPEETAEEGEMGSIGACEHNFFTVQDGGCQAMNRPSLFECCMVFPTSQMASEADLSSQ